MTRSFRGVRDIMNRKFILESIASDDTVESHEEFNSLQEISRIIEGMTQKTGWEKNIQTTVIEDNHNLGFVAKGNIWEVKQG